MPRKLPRFEPVGVEEGRALWKKYRNNADIQRLLLEIAHGRQVFADLDGYFSVVQKVWQEQGLGQLVAMEKMRLLLVEQSLRQRTLAGLKPAPRKDEPGEPEPALVD
jgi:hypothetical protein